MENSDKVFEIIQSQIKKEALLKVSPKILRTIKDTYISIHPETKHLDYETLASLINSVFDIHCTGRELWLLDEPTLEEDIIDLELQYKNLGL